MTLGSAGNTAPSTLRGLTRFLLRTTLTTAPFTDANVDALLYKHYHEFVNELLRSGSEIDFNMATETINLVANTQAHSVAGKVLRIKRIEVTYDGTNWRYVNIFDIGMRGKPID